jgi:dTDP-4-dehydrorhamnose reductase
MKFKPMKCLIFGHGQVGESLAALLSSQKIPVDITTRQISAPKRLHENGHLIPFSSVDFEGYTHILSTIPPRNDGDPVLKAYKNSLLSIKNTTPPWIGYISATSVYGDHEGRWVDETTPPSPSTQRGENRLSVEEEWKKHTETLCIFRVSGIYSSTHNLFAKRDEDPSRPFVFKKNHFTSRIYLKDLTHILMHAMMQKVTGIFNIADALPAPSHEVVTWFFEKKNLSHPLFIPYETWEGRRGYYDFYQENRRINGEKILNTTGYILQFPTYKEGYEDMKNEKVEEMKGKNIQ